MKRDRDGSQHQQHYEYQQQWPQHQQYQQHQHQQPEEIPPPPPPRNRPQQDIPPPPPPRIRPSSASRNGHAAAVSNGSSNHPPPAFAPATAAMGTASRLNGTGDEGGANVFTASSSSARAPSSSSTPTSAATKRPKLGYEHPDNWRATADEVLMKAGLEGGTKEGSSRARDEEGSSTRKGNDMKQQQQRQQGVTKTVAAARSRRRFAVVCSANFNRSMMAHKLLKEHNFQVESYGTGREVRLPGRDITSPEVFPFGTPYRDIFDKLKAKDEALFSQNNLLPLVARNATVKAAPQRFQEIEGPDMAGFDVVLCFETRVFYLVVEDLQSRDPETFKPLHVINMTIKDSFEESAAAAGSVLELCRTLDGVSQLEDETAGVLEVFTRKTKRTVLHQVCHV